MISGKDKISLRQAMFIYLLITISPIIRYLPSAVAETAKQAGWLSPFVAFIPMAVTVLMLRGIYAKYKEKSMMEIICDITGVFAGKFITALYLIYTIWLTAIYLRYSAERLVSTVYPHVAISVFLVSTLMIIAYTLRNGIVAIGRMSEIFFPLIILTFIFLAVFLIPDIRPDNILPVSLKDMVPIFRGGIAATALGHYIFLLFFMGDYINDKEKIMKIGMEGTVVYIAISVFVAITSIGTIGGSVASHMPLPFFVTIRHISALNIIERIESLLVGAWIYADFVLISAMTFISLNILKFLLKLSEIKYFINIFLVFIYFLSIGICVTKHELESFSRILFTNINIVMLILIPLIIFAVGKLRKKV